MPTVQIARIQIHLSQKCIMGVKNRTIAGSIKYGYAVCQRNGASVLHAFIRNHVYAGTKHQIPFLTKIIPFFVSMLEHSLGNTSLLFGQTFHACLCRKTHFRVSPKLLSRRYTSFCNSDRISLNLIDHPWRLNFDNSGLQNIKITFSCTEQSKPFLQIYEYMQYKSTVSRK